MSRTGVDYETIKHTAVKLLSQGIAPSVQKIREALGTGSNTTIAEHLKIWRDDYAKKTIHHLPSTLPKELIASMEVLWQTAMEQAENQFAAYKQSLADEHEAHLQLLNDAEKNNVIFNQTLKEQQLKIETLVMEKQNLTTELAILNDRLEKKDDILALEKNQYEARLQRVYQDKDTTLASLQEMKSENMTLREKLSQQAEENQLRFTKERTLQEQSENRWLNLIDQSKQETKELHKKLENHRQTQEKNVTQLNNQLNQMRQNIYEKDAQLKMVTEQLQQCKSENKALHIEVNKAKSAILKFESEQRLKKNSTATQTQQRARKIKATA